MHPTLQRARQSLRLSPSTLVTWCCLHGGLPGARWSLLKPRTGNLQQASNGFTPRLLTQRLTSYGLATKLPLVCLAYLTCSVPSDLATLASQFSSTLCDYPFVRMRCLTPTFNSKQSRPYHTFSQGLALNKIQLASLFVSASKLIKARLSLLVHGRP